MSTVKLPTSRKELNALAKKNGIEKPQFIPLAKLKKQVKEILKDSGGATKKKKRGPGRPPGSGKKKTTTKKNTTAKRGPGRPPGSGKKKAPAKGVPGKKKRGPGRPPGSGKKSPVKATPAKRGPGRPPGTGKKRGRPPKAETAAKSATKKTVETMEAFDAEAMEKAVKLISRRMKPFADFSEMYSEEFPKLVAEVKKLRADVNWLRKNFEELIASAIGPVEDEAEQPEEKVEETPKKKKKKKKKKTAIVEDSEVDENGEVDESKNPVDDDTPEEETTTDDDVVELDVDKIQSAKLPELYRMGDSVEYGEEMRKMKKDGKNVKYIRAAFLKYLKENADLD